MAILFHSDFGAPEPWLDELRRQLPDDEILLLGDVDDRPSIEFAVVWDLPVDEFATFPNLRAILLLGAGGSHLRPFRALPDVPVVRLVDDAVADDMAAYALHWVIHFHRHFQLYMAQQPSAKWHVHPFGATADHAVGILGYGNIGSRTAEVLVDSGYPVRAWSRSPKPKAPLETFTGTDELPAFLSGTHCLVNTLPLTDETGRILNQERLRMLPVGASVINMGRGGTMDDGALIAALDDGHLSAAALDVFRAEPLPPESPFWSHPKVVVTPHVSGAAQPRSSVSYVVANIERVRAGERPFPLFLPARGY